MLYDEDNNYFDNDTNIAINSIYLNRNNNLFNIEDGFNNGNMFKNIYSKYKNHVYKLKINNKKDELLYIIQMHVFALKDLGLYLDINPNDNSILKEYLTIKTKLEDAKNKYQKLYGPLCQYDQINDNKWNYIDNPWPWDKGGN